MTIQTAREVAHSAACFRNRVEYLIVRLAMEVVAERTDAPLHAARVALARQILASPEAHVTRFGLAVLSDPGMLKLPSYAAISDEALEAAINTVYNAFTTADLNVPKKWLGLFPRKGAE